MTPTLQFETEATCMVAKAFLDDGGIHQHMNEPKLAVDSYKTWCLPMEKSSGSLRGRSKRHSPLVDVTSPHSRGEIMKIWPWNSNPDYAIKVAQGMQGKVALVAAPLWRNCSTLAHQRMGRGRGGQRRRSRGA